MTLPHDPSMEKTDLDVWSDYVLMKGLFTFGQMNGCVAKNIFEQYLFQLWLENKCVGAYYVVF